MASTISVPAIQQLLIEDELAKSHLAVAAAARSDLDSLSANGVVWNSGFVNRTDSAISFSDSTLTLTIAPAVTSYQVVLNEVRETITASHSVSWTDVEGIHFFYFGSDGVLKTTQDVDVWLAQFTTGGAGVAAIYWDATNNQSIRRIDERHGVLMPGSTHVYLHRYMGTQYESGGALGDFTIATGNGSLPAHAQFSVADAVISDEDIRFAITGGSPQVLSTAAQIPVFYLTGSGAWRRKAADAYPVIYSGSAGYTGANGLLAWNQLSGGTWSLQEVSSGNYVMVHYFLTTDVLHPVIGVQGQAIHTALTAVRAAANVEISSIIGLTKLLSTEKRPLATVIFQTSVAYSNTPLCRIVQTDTGTNYEDWRLERSLPV